MNTQKATGNRARINRWLACAALAGVTGHVATAAAATGVVAVGQPFNIDTLVSTDRSYDSWGSTAMAADGTAVVAWSVQSGTYFDNYIVARRIAADGTPLTPDILVDNTPGNYSQESIPVVASDPAGNFVVVWSGYGPSSAIAYRLFAADGTPRTAATCVAADCKAWGGEDVSDVSMDNAGDFAVLANVQNSPYLYFFHPDGTAGAVQAVPQASGTTTQYGSISMNRQNGNVDVAWVQHKQVRSNFFYTTHNYQAFLQRYASDGSALGSPVQEVNCTETIYINNKVYGCDANVVSVAQDDAGNRMVAWSQIGYSKGVESSRSVYARTYDPSGALITGKTQLSPPPTASMSVSGLLNVRATAPSSFVVAWYSIDSTDPLNPANVTTLSSVGMNGQTNGPATQFTFPGSWEGSIAADSAGNLLGIWLTGGGDGINSGVVGQFFQQQ